ncbi:MAG: imidazolonepropionase [Firmicutes bacterium]|nr:imidazolonepropionase [Bacillota bacterium]
MTKKLIKNIGVLATPSGSKAKAGSDQGKINQLEHAWLLWEDDKIIDLGQGAPPSADQEIDANGHLVTPGLVDPHTHLVFGGWREHELAMKLKGVPYLDILAAGGGILSTVRSTRAASKEQLISKTLPILERMLALGVTTCEAKSGYGLALEHEIKMLEAVKELGSLQPIELVSTFMAAHALPEEYKADREAYLDLVINTMIPQVAEKGLAEYCDVFCETGVFTADESRRVLLAGQQAGLASKCHSDEIDPIGGTEMAGSIGAVSCEHLIACTPSGIQAMAQGGVIACCLPATSFYLNAGFAPARDMISAGVPVAFGSDFNPGSCPVHSLQIAMNIGCYKYRMTPEESLTAVTLNAASAIGRAELVGTIEPGKQADFLIWDAPNLDYIFYRFGDNLVKSVFKKGLQVR